MSSTPHIPSYLKCDFPSHSISRDIQLQVVRSGIPSGGRLTNFNSRKIERPDKAKDRPRRDSISAKTFSIKSPSYSGKHTFYTVTGRLIIYSYPKVKIEQDHDWEIFSFPKHSLDWLNSSWRYDGLSASILIFTQPISLQLKHTNASNWHKKTVTELLIFSIVLVVQCTVRNVFALSGDDPIIWSPIVS